MEWYHCWMECLVLCWGHVSLAAWIQGIWGPTSNCSYGDPATLSFLCESYMFYGRHLMCSLRNSHFILSNKTCPVSFIVFISFWWYTYNRDYTQLNKYQVVFVPDEKKSVRWLRSSLTPWNPRSLSMLLYFTRHAISYNMYMHELTVNTPVVSISLVTVMPNLPSWRFLQFSPTRCCLWCTCCTCIAPGCCGRGDGLRLPFPTSLAAVKAHFQQCMLNVRLNFTIQALLSSVVEIHEDWDWTQI